MSSLATNSTNPALLQSLFSSIQKNKSFWDSQEDVSYIQAQQSIENNIQNLQQQILLQKQQNENESAQTYKINEKNISLNCNLQSKNSQQCLYQQQSESNQTQQENVEFYHNMKIYDDAKNQKFQQNQIQKSFQFDDNNNENGTKQLMNQTHTKNLNNSGIESKIEQMQKKENQEQNIDLNQMLAKQKSEEIMKRRSGLNQQETEQQILQLQINEKSEKPLFSSQRKSQNENSLGKALNQKLQNQPKQNKIKEIQKNGQISNKNIEKTNSQANSNDKNNSVQKKNQINNNNLIGIQINMLSELIQKQKISPKNLQQTNLSKNLTGLFNSSPFNAQQTNNHDKFQINK
ncbi:hypothetical protein PPERSA_08819 [Pseudocohnilembus persalinus]|uniref:Uncharacterized protein n=1 Tax=Pseudocohnilembus persalinus TaxID=266149 RepID=A0A0V0R3P4_PSEPJ|nr:hypothetical protein PPERSA_08819 [Pseudocohnilembus persalinus]|eukprot:KRX09103.1 hypothetical protein PPERSA_08819 [Pseudocohnilembus persalinus]